jgi:peptide/nickel transport system permease protein
MLRYLSRRLLAAIPILIGVAIVVFITLKLTPGNPVDSLLGPTSTPQDRSQLTRQLGLDKPIPIQFWDWFSQVLRGNFGTSIAQQLPARPIVLHAFANTLLLAGFAALLAIVFGIALGALSAIRARTVSGATAAGFSLFAVSAPQYSLALVLIIVFSVRFHLLPPTGMHDPAGPGGVADLSRHLLLPGVCAALVPMGIIARMFRSSMLEVLGQDFFESYRARGLPMWRIYMHAFHNTLPSFLTVAGLQVGYLLGGVVFVETVFSWPGIGLLVYNSISQRDLPVIQASVLVSAVAFVVINVIVDVVHASIDPRVRRWPTRRTAPRVSGC